MKNKLIRRGVFETNSSSSHVISIASDGKDFVLDTISPNEDGCIILTGGAFGWELEKYNDALTKANYCMVYAIQWAGEDKEAFSTALKDVIKEQTGCEDVIFVYDEKSYDSYIDHESVEKGQFHYLFEHPDLLRNFIFNKNSWLYLGNDNRVADPIFYIVPEYKSDGTVIEPDFKYRLRVCNCNGGGFLEKETFFLEKPTEQEIDKALTALLSERFIDTDGDWKTGGFYSDSEKFELKPYLFGKHNDHVNNLCFFIRGDIFDVTLKMAAEDPAYASMSHDEQRAKEDAIEKNLLDETNSQYVIPINFYVEEIPQR